MATNRVLRIPRKKAWNVECMKNLKKFGAGAGVVAIAAALATPAWLLLLAIKNEDKILKGKDKKRANEVNSKRV